MPRKFELFIAGRYLRSRRKEVFISINGIISVLAVAISVMVLDMMLSIMTGFEVELRNKLIGANAHVIVRQKIGNLEDWQNVQAEAANVDGVLAAFPYTYNQALVSSSLGSRGMIVKGIANHLAARQKAGEYLEKGSDIEALFAEAPLNIVRPDGVHDTVMLPSLIVGRELRRRLGFSLGSPVTIFSPRLTSSPQGLIPKQRRFVVVGSYSSGLAEYEGGLAYTSLESAQSFFGLKNAVTGVEVQVRDLDSASRVAQAILAKLGGENSPFYVTDWTQQNKAFWDALRLEKQVYFTVLLLLVLVASFSVVSTLVMLVMEKGQDIAILKSMGASDSSILSIFLTQGSLIGLVGTVLGTLLGVLGCVGLREYGFEIEQSVFSLDKVPVLMEPVNFVVVAASALLITSVVGFYPAIRAARMNPADTFRFE